MNRRDLRSWKEALADMRRGDARRSSMDPFERMFAASQRYLRGCQNQYDAVRGIWDEVKEGSYTSDRILPDTLSLYGGWFDEIVGTWEVLCKGEVSDHADHAYDDGDAP